MKKFFRQIKDNILAYAAVYTLIFIGCYFLLNFFSLGFRQWVYIVSAIFVVGGLLIGVIRLDCFT